MDQYLDATDRLRLMWLNRDELAACLREAVTGMELLQAQTEARLYLPGLPDLIKRSEAALKEYGK